MKQKFTSNLWLEIIISTKYMIKFLQIKMQDQHPGKVPLIGTEVPATPHTRLSYATEI